LGSTGAKVARRTLTKLTPNDLTHCFVHNNYAIVTLKFFYYQLFYLKVLFAAIFYFQFVFVFVCRMEVGVKDVLKMLVIYID